MHAQDDFTHADQFGILSSHITRHYHLWAKAHGISYNQLAVLHSLVRLGQCTQKQICDNWVLPKQTISIICKQYVAQGLIIEQLGSDRREKQMTLSEQGHHFAHDIIAKLDQAEAAIFQQFGAKRSQALLQEFHAISQLFALHFGGEQSDFVSRHDSDNGDGDDGDAF